MNLNNIKTVAFYTLGCKVNHYETDSLKKQFLEAGYELVNFEDIASVYVVNTCTVTHISDRKCRNILRRPKKLNPNAIVVATGCYAQTDAKSLSEIEDIDLIVGNKEKNNICEIVENYDFFKNSTKSFVDSISKHDEYVENDILELESRDKTRAYIKIQDGCDRFCTFCKVPFARGPKKSRPLTSIIEEAKKLLASGYKEIVIIGINIGAYGEDLPEKITLDDLLEQLLELQGLDRLRISSIYPDNITDRLIEMMKNNRRLMPHLHISLQSADDMVLKMMNRKYNSELLYDIFNKLKSNISELALTADIIVGFPFEKEANFINTYKFVKHFEFSNLHIFPYSDRENTIAAAYTEKVNSHDKYDRFKRLEELRIELEAKFASRYIDKDVEVLIEKVRNGEAYAYTDNYLKVFVDNCDGMRYSLQTIRINSFEDGILKGTVKNVKMS